MHLSDLHFGHGKEAATRFDQKLVTDKLIEDARRVARVLGPPDAIFLTGDIAFAAAEKEYAAATEWLDKLLAALKLTRGQLLVVPGNHDVDRKKATTGVSRHIHGNLRAKPNDVNSLLEEVDTMKEVWTKLTSYQGFARVFGSDEIIPAKPFWTTTISSNLGPVTVMGLNTTLLSFDNQDRGNLALGMGQIMAALEKTDPNALLFVLQHHPPDWLRDGTELLTMLKDRAHLLLCGHVHDQHGFVTLPLTSRGNVMLVAGAGHMDAKEEGEHAYAWGRVTRNGLEYYPRAWLKKELRFENQRMTQPTDQKGYHRELGEYVIYDRSKLPESFTKWLQEAPTLPIGPSKDSLSGVAAFRAAPDEAHAPTPAVAPFDPANNHVHIPFPAKGEQVVGRADALQKVRDQLVRGRRTAIGQTAAFVGLGGLGKTQLAVEYAHSHKHAYPRGIYWFDADRDLHAQLTLLAMAARWVSPLSEPRFMHDVALHQIRTRSNCLIIFDNVEDLKAIEPLLPEGSAAPHLLITSRVAHAGFDQVPIERLNEAESLEMLRLASGRALDAPADSEAAMRIARQLDGLPLALELAGAYLGQYKAVTSSAYADLLQAEGVKARGLRDGRLASFTKHSPDLYATLHIHESLLEQSPLLRNALDLLAWSGSASMGRELLASLLDSDSAELDVVLGEAETFRILKQEQGGDSQEVRYQMHRLVREVRQAEVPVEKDSAQWLNVIDRLGTWFEKRRDDFAHLRVYEAEFDHLETWQAHADRLGHSRDAVRLSWLRAYPYYYRGQYQTAREIVELALRRYEETGINDAILEAHLQNDLGLLLHKLGEARKAFDCCHRSLQIRLATLGEKHRDTAMSLNNLGGWFSDSGEHQLALQYDLRALAIRRELFGDKHQDTAMSLDNLGRELGRGGHHNQALEYARYALEIRREVLGEKHPHTALSIANTGASLSWLGKHHEAREYDQRAMDIRKEILGENHPDTAHSFRCLGITLENLGDTPKALQHFLAALSIHKQTVGDLHPDTIATWRSIVRLHMRQKKKAAALAFVEDELKRFPHNADLKNLKRDILRNKAQTRTSKQISKPAAKIKPAKR